MHDSVINVSHIHEIGILLCFGKKKTKGRNYCFETTGFERPFCIDFTLSFRFVVVGRIAHILFIYYI